MRWGVVTFPGSNDDRDALHVVERVLGDEAVPLWHKDRDFRGVDCVILPGGFSYGDYLRCGAMAKFSPIMAAVVEHAVERLLVGDDGLKLFRSAQAWLRREPRGDREEPRVPGS